MPQWKIHADGIELLYRWVLSHLHEFFIVMILVPNKNISLDYYD